MPDTLQGNNLTGLSLSLCVYDIASGHVAIGQVARIITGFKFDSLRGDRRGLEYVCATYQQQAWRGLPEATAIALQLFDEGKVEMPTADLTTHRERGLFKSHWLAEDGSAIEHPLIAETQEEVARRRVGE